ncbi:hypothetical protein [Paenibacillus lentus]|nr:hypothetical protein [Paenibacillus lentus]
MFSKTGDVYSVGDMGKPGVGFYYESWSYNDLAETLTSWIFPWFGL